MTSRFYSVVIGLKSSMTRQNLLPILRHQNRRSIYSGLPSFQQAGFGKIIAILSPFANVGGTAAYAKYENKFRQTLVSSVPGAEAILKILLQEEGNAIDEASKSIGKATQKISKFSSNVSGCFGGTKVNEPAAPTKPKEIENVKSTKTPVADFATPPLPKVTKKTPTPKPAAAEMVVSKQVVAPKAVPTSVCKKT